MQRTLKVENAQQQKWETNEQEQKMAVVTELWDICAWNVENIQTKATLNT